MFVFRHGSRHLQPVARSFTTSVRRTHASKIRIPFAPPPVPVIESCPVPTCQCRESPSGLDIERESNINGSMASYGEQVLISTGREDWKSKIEDEEDAVLVRQLKKFLLRNGKYADVCGQDYCCSRCTAKADGVSLAISQCDDNQFFFQALKGNS